MACRAPGLSTPLVTMSSMTRSTTDTATSSGVGVAPGHGCSAYQCRGDLVHEHALGRAAAVDGEGNAETAQDLDLGLVPEDLGIDEEPVHVEDGRGEPRRTGVRRCQAVSCASISATIVASSGSTWGR